LPEMAAMADWEINVAVDLDFQRSEPVWQGVCPETLLQSARWDWSFSMSSAGPRTLSTRRKL